VNLRLLVSMNRQDFGYAIARTLAIVIWLVSANNLMRVVVLQMTILTEHWTRGWLVQSAPEIVYTVALAYAGYRLWIGAEGFGSAPGSSESGDPIVVASRSLLASGLAMGIALYPLIHGVIGCVGYFMELVQAGETGTIQKTSSLEFGVSLFSLLLGGTIFGWAYVSASKVQVPEFEYTSAGGDEPTNPPT
jgi:hypothetical protein